MRLAAVYRTADEANEAIRVHPLINSVAYVEPQSEIDTGTLLFSVDERKALAAAPPIDRARMATEIYNTVHTHLPDRIRCGHAGCQSPESMHPNSHDLLTWEVRCRCDSMLVVMAHVRVMVRVMVQMDDRLWLRVG